MNPKDLTGQRFGRLIVIERSGTHVSPNGHTTPLWRCKCDCGNEAIVKSCNLYQHITLSCGCYHKETFTHATHGRSRTRLYRIWCAMKDRCNRPGAINYKWYGGSGVKVCDEWSNSFTAFSEWAKSSGYKDDLTIDRIDSSRGYEPNNCRWITREENARIAARQMQDKRREHKHDQKDIIQG